MKAMSKTKLVCGVGINDADYPVTAYAVIGGRETQVRTCPIYQAWSSMIKRCYSEKLHARRPTYAGCSVAPEWHRFSKFREWMITQDWKGKQLDKDILIQGNKVYSSETCVFITRALNLFMTEHGGARGEWPIGVCWHKASGKFMVRCRNPFTGRRECLGHFTDQEESREAWRAKKHELACIYADQQTDPRIANALRARYANKIGEEA